MILGVFFLISSVLKLFTLITAEFYIRNMPVFHLLAAVEIVFVFCFYSELMFKRIYLWVAVALLLMNVVNTIFIQDVFTFNSIAWTLDMMILITIGMLYLFQLYKQDEDYTPLEKRPDFIITAGWLIYASGSLFTYLMGTSILSGRAEGFFHNAWIFQCVSNLAKNAIISYGLWKVR